MSSFSQWWLLTADGKPFPAEKQPERPIDAVPLEDGSIYTPWGRLYNHLHVHPETKEIVGIHARGTLFEVQHLLSACQFGIVDLPRQDFEI